MKKVHVKPRENWIQQCEEAGFYFHSIDGKYWVEEYAIEFTAKEIDLLEDAGNELHAMGLDLVSDVVKKGDYEKYRLMPHLGSEIEKSWNNKDFHLYSRFDMSFDGKGFPKLLEYNADTPTSLLESSVIQWDWLQGIMPEKDQFNSIHEKLVDRWKKFKQQKNSIHFSCDERSEEEWCNLEYLKSTAKLAGLDAKFLTLNEIRWDENKRIFIDNQAQKIDNLFKLYPWEFLIEDKFYPYIKENSMSLIEPMWKMLLSTKAILPLLWEKYPEHPNLLPAFWNEEEIKKLNVNYVKKPMLSREGENVEIYNNGVLIDTQPGTYGKEGFIYQERKDIVEFDNRYSMLGLWIVGDSAAGIGIREDVGRITKDTSWFVPHYFVE